MNAEIKRLWVEALRSGEYQQGRGQLRDGDQFCCLGVLCDLHSKAGLGEWRGDIYNDHIESLPESVVVWADVPDSCPYVTGGLLTDYNDGVIGGDLPLSFTEIADLIERSL